MERILTLVNLSSVLTKLKSSSSSSSISTTSFSNSAAAWDSSAAFLSASSSSFFLSTSLASSSSLNFGNGLCDFWNSCIKFFGTAGGECVTSFDGESYKADLLFVLNETDFLCEDEALITDLLFALFGVLFTDEELELEFEIENLF
ncbi:hypothetical protein WICMUC_003397 [Wickerhamomyces mucosus]|uniref:Uncharacterized protein n=1 Tax=Wickerhamomyces mucosus TaxID=1378264 RepID=A0A9P8PMR5_9ASCO|nr:hypothetical protein WICMUC_003397 [Wickerhamomyces mucosus]